MQRFNAVFTPEAEREFIALEKTLRKRMIVKLEYLVANFEVLTHLPLSYKHKGFYKIRVGDYRIIYRLDYEKKQGIIVKIGHRSKIYKNL